MDLLHPGERVTDTLVVDRKLGEGAYAEVYRVEHDYLGRLAMKVFKRITSREETREVLAEARLLSTLGHPHIVRLFDAGVVHTPDGERGFFTMEYVPGGSLDRFIEAHSHCVPARLAVQIMEQVARGLAVAHGHTPPILHRDLIPPNILIGYDAGGVRTRISDFGLAKHADPFTQLASAQGTYAFLAPEVLRDELYAAASDVWSLGAVLYILLTDHLPYDAPEMIWSPVRYQRRLLPPSAYNDQVDAVLDRIVLATLELRAGDRLPGAERLADELRAWRTALDSDGRDPADDRVRAPSGTGTDIRAQRLADEALVLARHPATLHLAADLMEEAVNLSPQLWHRYLPRLKVWRRGLMA